MDVAQKVLASDPWPGVTLVQVTLIAALGGLAWLTAQRAGPALRGAVVLAALVGLLVVPALATVAPVWLPLPGIAPVVPAPEPTRSVEVVRVTVPAPVPPERPAAPPIPLTKPMPLTAPLPADIIDPVEEPAPLEASEPAAVALLPAPTAETPVPEPAEPLRSAPSVTGILVGVWLFGAALYLMRAGMSLAILYVCAWRARPIRDEEWAECRDSLPDRADRPRVALRESRVVGSPLTLGLFRSVILLPKGWRDWSLEQLRLVLAHELAHVRRRDFIAGLVSELAVCLCWFHPLVRFLAGRLRLEQEYAADAEAASAAGDAMDYIRCLARLALEQGAGRSAPAPALWRRRPEILRRIDMLRRNRDGFPSPLKWRTAGAVVALAAAACVTVAGIGPLRAIAVGAAPPDEPAPAAKAPAGADGRGDSLPAGALARLGTTRWRHGSPIHYVAFGPEDKTLVTAGQDNTVRLWDMTTGQELRRFARPAPEGRPPANPAQKIDALAARQRALFGGVGGFGVALSPDGKTIAIAGETAVQLYEVATGKELSKIRTPQAGLAGLLFSPDGKTLAGRLSDGGLTLWDATTGKERHQLRVPPRPENNRDVVVVLRGGGEAPGMAFTPDGTGFLASTVEYREQNYTGRITLWDVDSGKDLRDVKKVPNAFVGGVAVAPGGKVIAYCSGGMVHACKADTGEALFQTRLTSAASVVTFSPDGKLLAVRGVTQQVRVLDAESGKDLFPLGDPVGPRGGVVGGGGFAVPLAVTPEVRDLAFTSDGKRIVTAAGGTVRAWEAATGKEQPLSDGHVGTVTGAVLSADGKIVVSWGTDRTIRRWDAVSGKPLSVFPVPPTASVTAVSADGGTVALAGGGTIHLVDPNGGKELLQFKGNARGASAVVFSPDGKMLAERGADTTLRVYDLTKGGEARQFAAQPAAAPFPPGAVVVATPGRFVAAAQLIVFSPDGNLLATAGTASPGDVRVVGGRPPARPTASISLIDTQTGKTLRKIEPSVTVVSCAFSPDGRVLATENADESVSLWEVASGKERARLGPGSAPVEAIPAPGGAGNVKFVAGGPGFGGGEPSAPATLAFSPDGRVLVGRGPDRSVRVWDVEGGKEVGRFKGHDGRVESVGFSPDGKTVATGSTDTTMLVWDAAALRKDLQARQRTDLPDGAADALWTDLVGEDAGKAGKSVLKLAAAPRQAVPFLGERLKPAAAIDRQKLDQWIADLETDKFAVRQEAIANLLKAGEQAVPALQKVLGAEPALETRLRVEELLDKLTGGTLTAEQLRLVRAVEALEKIATPEARAVLRALAGGAPGALPTREARAAFDRLGVR
jgi:WD40 repeat protein/beta-lactamase regulating signal transducer with metallopeptidase domain